MTALEFRQGVEAVLADVQVAAPVELADTIDLRAALTVALGAPVEVYHRHQDIVILAFEDGAVAHRYVHPLTGGGVLA